MVADLMLNWMSETGAGSVRELRDRLAWLARTAGLSSMPYVTGRWLRDVSALGHCEVDWHEDRWAVTPPTLARLPAADGAAVLAGSRRAGDVERLESTDLSVHRVAPEPAQGDLDVPECVVVQFDSNLQLAAAAREAGVGYAGVSAARLSKGLPSAAVGRPAAPPSVGNESLQRLVHQPGGVAFEDADARSADDGLYRLRLQGKQAHLYREDGNWYRCDLADGVFLELARDRIGVIRWRPDAGPGRQEVGSAFIDWGSPLPALHARALALCSGLPPRFSEAARTAIYGNVPLPVIQAVATSLGQRVKHLPAAG